MMKWTCSLLNNKWGGGCVNILDSLECQTEGEAEEVVLNTSSLERHLSFYSRLTRKQVFLDQLILPGSHLGRQTAAGCRWCLRRSGIFSDLSSLAPLRHPAGQRHRKFTPPTGRKAPRHVKLKSQGAAEAAKQHFHLVEFWNDAASLSPFLLYFL